AMFASHGIGAERLDLRPPAGLDQYLQNLSSVDIALDTLPFNGGTTTCHFLWMGVPVVTLHGETSVSRMGLSILSNVGLTELIARDSTHFVEIASDLARDLRKLNALRETMRSRMNESLLLDAPARTRDLENAYRAVWREWC